MFLVCKHKAILTFIAIPIYFILAVLGVEGSVLCFGDDQHLAIEFVQASNGSGSSSSLGCAAYDDACGSCVDVAFQSSALYPAAVLSNLTQHGLHLSFHVAFAAPSFDFIQKTASRQIPIQTTLSGSKSVVLLI